VSTITAPPGWHVSNGTECGASVPIVHGQELTFTIGGTHCTGCGRCRTCGQPAPAPTPPIYPGPYPTLPWTPQSPMPWDPQLPWITWCGTPDPRLTSR
jgi:hypothetical protein